jgi:hypothetical protein
VTIRLRGRGQYVDAASRWVAASAVLLGALAFIAPDVNGSDLWWHLASGREIWEQAEIPRTDPFSHTAAGEPWTNHAWLWGAIAWPLYDANPDWVAGLNYGIVVAVFGLVAWNSWRASRSWLATGCVTWLAAAASLWFLDVRPHLMTLLLSALLLATFEWRRAPWLWPPLLALWTNLHGGFIFGLGLIGLHVLVRSAGPLLRRQPKRLPRAEWIGLTCAMLAVGLNPWGFEILTIPLQPLDPDTPFRELIEWRPVSFELDPRGYAGRFSWLAIAAGVGVIRARNAPYLVALAAVTLAMSLSARRFVPLFAVTAAPLAALGIGIAIDAVGRRLPVVAGSGTRLIASGTALLVALLLWQDVRWLPGPLQRWTHGEWYPAGAATYLASMRNPPRRLFNAYEWGGFVSLRAPRIPVFIDGRAGTVYDDSIARDYRTIIEVAPGWRERLVAREIDAALLETGSPLAIALRRQSPRWRVAHLDPRSVLLFPPPDDSRATLPLPRRLITDLAELQLGRGTAARRRGDLTSATEHLRDVVRIDPLQLFAYEELALVSALEGDAPEVRHWIEQARLVYPRRRNQIWAFAEHAWRIMENREGQLEALQQLDTSGPFLDDERSEQVRARIHALSKNAPTSLP